MDSQTLIKQLSVTAVFALIATGLFTTLLEIRIVNALIAVHVIYGSLAFLVGGLALVAQKGAQLHKLTGTLFFLFMTISTVFTLIVAIMPYHFSTSMFQISVMTLYFLVGGIRSLSFNKANHRLYLDYGLLSITIVISVFILFYSKWLYGGFQPLQTVFGLVAVAFCATDIGLFLKPGYAQKYWLALHLTKMLAGYATAVTGFFVAQQILGGYFDWFTPTVITFVMIFYWLVKLRVIGINIRPKNLLSTSSNH